MNNKEEKEEKNKAFQEIRRRNVNLGNMSCIAKKFTHILFVQFVCQNHHV